MPKRKKKGGGRRKRRHLHRTEVGGMDILACRLSRSMGSSDEERLLSGDYDTVVGVGFGVVMYSIVESFVAYKDEVVCGIG